MNPKSNKKSSVLDVINDIKSQQLGVKKEGKFDSNTNALHSFQIVNWFQEQNPVRISSDFVNFFVQHLTMRQANPFLVRVQTLIETYLDHEGLLKDDFRLEKELAKQFKQKLLGHIAKVLISLAKHPDEYFRWDTRDRTPRFSLFED